MHVIELSLQVVPESGAGVQPIIVVVSRNKSGADEDGKRDASASPVWGGRISSVLTCGSILLR